jgi:hypothetical protein
MLHRRLVTERLVRVALPPVIFTFGEYKVLAVSAVTEALFRLVSPVEVIFASVAVPVAVMLVPVAFPKRRLVMEASAADRKLVRKLPLFTMLAEVVVPVRLRLFRVPMVVVETTPFTVETRELAASPV